MQLSTTPDPGRVHHHRILRRGHRRSDPGANIFRDFFAGVRDIVGGRSGAYEKELRKARLIAFEELEDQAKELGANAVVGIDIDYETVGKRRQHADGDRQRHRGESQPLIPLPNALARPRFTLSDGGFRGDY